MAKTYTREEFAKEYGPFIDSVTKGTGILPGTLTAQAILESSGKYNTGGQWVVGGSQLAQEANNYFGIKADAKWKGPSYNISTREETGSAKSYYIKDDFRKYGSVKDSIRDYVSFLKSNPRYEKAGVFTAKTVSQQAAALEKAGYATAHNYDEVVTQVYNQIKNNLYTAAKLAKQNWIPIAILLGTGVGLAVYFSMKKK